MLRFVASALVVLDSDSGITGGVSADAVGHYSQGCVQAAFGGPSVDAILTAASPGVNQIFGRVLSAQVHRVAGAPIAALTASLIC
jgi:hypothetical protein